MHTKMIPLSKKLTIVVPCKNEENYIGHMLTGLRAQKISDTKIIIADSSSDNTRTMIAANSQFLNIEVVNGGTVSQARNIGAAKATTPYILFLDADVLFHDNYVIRDAVEAMETQKLDLVTAKIYCYADDWRAELGFSMFNAVNLVLSRFSPFAVGAFMLTRKTVFDSIGGFDEHYITSEDFFLSRQYNPKKFKILNHYFGQDNRRFKKMGYFGMAGYLIKNFVNRDNPAYWDQMSHQRYWS